LVEHRVGYVDALRCIAALAVLAQHLLELADPVRFAGFLDCAPGVFGVVLFFYISGFVVPLSIRKRPPVSSFLLRRLFRIYPAYLASLVLAVVLAWPMHEQNPFVRVGVVGSVLNLLLVQEYFHAPAILGVTWTLSIEFVWYGLFAIIAYGVPKLRVSWLVLLFSLGMVLLSLVALQLHVRAPAGRFGLIGAALIGYLSWQKRAGELQLREYAVAVGVFCAAMAFSLYIAFGIFSHPTIRLYHSALPWTAATLLFLLSTHECKVVQRALDSRVLGFLGEISYSLYLLHALLIVPIITVAGAQLALVLTPIVCVIAAWGFHRGVELPGVRLGKRVERALSAREEPLGRASA
jgi:peptidoglycan/LPS O-acetylase OafA/YrhL